MKSIFDLFLQWFISMCIWATLLVGIITLFSGCSSTICPLDGVGDYNPVGVLLWGAITLVVSSSILAWRASSWYARRLEVNEVTIDDIHSEQQAHNWTAALKGERQIFLGRRS